MCHMPIYVSSSSNKYDLGHTPQKSLQTVPVRPGSHLLSSVASSTFQQPRFPGLKKVHRESGCKFTFSMSMSDGYHWQLVFAI